MTAEALVEYYVYTTHSALYCSHDHQEDVPQIKGRGSKVAKKHWRRPLYSPLFCLLVGSLRAGSRMSRQPKRLPRTVGRLNARRGGEAAGRGTNLVLYWLPHEPY